MEGKQFVHLGLGRDDAILCSAPVADSKKPHECVPAKTTCMEDLTISGRAEPAAPPFFFPEPCYLKLHLEFTLLAAQHIQDPEAAADLASKVLVDWWQQALVRKEGWRKADALHYLFQNSLRWQRRDRCRQQAEQTFLLLQLPVQGWRNSLRWDQQRLLLRLSVSLPPAERTVVRAILVEEEEEEAISIRLGRPIAAIRLIRDRAIYLLRKRLSTR